MLGLGFGRCWSSCNLPQYYPLFLSEAYSNDIFLGARPPTQTEDTHPLTAFNSSLFFLFWNDGCYQRCLSCLGGSQAINKSLN